MAEPDLVAASVAAMGDAVDLPVTVKTRIGIDDQDSYELLAAFTEKLAAAGCRRLIVHARKAWLKGLSPKQNRDLPPLDYPRVYRLKRDFPEMTIVINGGIPDLAAAADHLRHVDGVMLGRAAYQNPYVLAAVDRRFFGATAPPPSREEVIAAFLPYLETERAAGVPLKCMTRHILGALQRHAEGQALAAPLERGGPQARGRAGGHRGRAETLAGGTDVRRRLSLAAPKSLVAQGRSHLWIVPSGRKAWKTKAKVTS